MRKSTPTAPAGVGDLDRHPAHGTADARFEHELLFVYGSLKRGFQNHGVMGSAQFEGVARTAARYGLVQISEYAALTAGERAISGELYRVSPEMLEDLDAFEGEEYVRRPVVLADGRQPHAYFIAPQVRDRARPLNADVWTHSSLE